MQISFAQRPIQHEPERIFNALLLGKSTTEYAKSIGLKKIAFYRDTVLSSSIEFDENGNFIKTIGMENNSVRTSTYKWDNQGRMIETKHFFPDGSFRYGYFYRYMDGAEWMYKIEDSTLFRKESFLKGENISTYSEYDSVGNIMSKNVYVKDKDMNWLLETRFSNDRIRVQYRYEYLDNKEYVTKVQFDDNGTKISENRRLKETKTGNRIEHYREGDDLLFRIDTLDEKGHLLEMKLLDENGVPIRIVTSEYNLEGQLIKKTEKYLGKDDNIIYSYQYDDSGKIDSVVKDSNGAKEVFRYVYITF